MSWTVRDSIRGRRIALVYGAAQLPLSTAVGRWQRSREVLRHLRRTRSRTVLATPDSDGRTETWWSAEEAGVSFAAAIDHWIETRLADEDAPLPEEFVVVIPLDTRIYLAEAAQNVVREERVLFPDPAAEQLDRHSAAGTVIYGFAAGTCTELPEQYVRLETPPFDLQRFRFARQLPVFLRKGLPHPQQLFIAAAVLLLAAGLQFGYQFARSAWQAGIPQTLQPSGVLQQVVEPNVPHSAGAELRALARLVVSAEPLFADGLADLAFSHGQPALYSGLRKRGYPRTARAVAETLGAEWRLDDAGWQLSVPLRIDPGHRRPGPTEPVTRAMLEHPLALRLADGPRRSSGQQSGNILVRAVDLAVYAAEPESLTAQDLLDAAGPLDGLPVSLASADCRFEAFRLQTCALTFEARTR